MTYFGVSMHLFLNRSSDSPLARPRSAMSVKRPSGEAHSLVHDYTATMAVVGKKKIGQLETLIMDKIYARVSRQTPNAYQKIWRCVCVLCVRVCVCVCVKHITVSSSFNMCMCLHVE